MDWIKFESENIEKLSQEANGAPVPLWGTGAKFLHGLVPLKGT